jgi:hypothetical protein
MTVTYKSSVVRDSDGKWYIVIPDSMRAPGLLFNLVEDLEIELEYMPKSKALIIRRKP